MLRTLAIISNQIVLSFGVFDSFFLSPKQSKIEGELCIIHGKASGSSFTRRIQAFELFSPLPKANQECKEEKQREKSNMKKSKRIATVGLISNTLWNPFYVYYMSFQNLGSQESNASNSTQIRVEMKNYGHWKTITPS